MSAINFDITGDNDNIMSVIDDTIDGFKKMSDTMKSLGGDIDLSNAENAVEQLGTVFEHTIRGIRDLSDELAQYRKEMEEAMMAGDTDKVAEIGEKMKETGEAIQKLMGAGNQIEEILSKTEKGRQKLDEVNESLGNMPKEIGKSKSAFSGLFKSIVPGIAKLGSIAGITMILKKVANDATQLTQRVGDAWGREVSGWKTMYESFVRSIGSGKGWTELVSDMSKAYAVGKKLYDILDELFEMNNSLNIKEAEYSKAIAEDRMTMMDSSASYEERIAAANDMIEKEKKLGEYRKTVRQKELDAATQQLELETDLNEKQRDFIIKKYLDNSEIIEQAKEYGTALQNQVIYERAAENATKNMTAASTAAWDNALERQAKYTKMAEDYQAVIDSASEDIKEVWQMIEQYNEGSDKTIQTWAQSYATFVGTDAETQNATRRAETTKNRLELEQKQKRQAYAELRRKTAQSNIREIKQNELEQRQAEIDAMKEGSEKVLAQIDLDHDKEKESIENWYDDLREKKIQKAKELWEANPNNKGEVFTYNINDKKWGATEQEKELYRQKTIALEYKYTEKRGSAQRATDDTLNAYLEEYGNYWQKRQAIAKEYQDKIADTEDEWEKARLAKERDNKLKEVSRNRDYLVESNRYEDKRLAIEQEAQDKLADLKEREAELWQMALESRSKEETAAIDKEITENKHAQEIVAENTKNALDDLEEQYSDFYKRLAKDRTDWIVGDTLSLLKDAEARLAKFGDVSQITDKDQLERIQRLKEEIKGLKQELTESFTPAGILKSLLKPGENADNRKGLNERLKDFIASWKKLTADQKASVLGNYIDSLGNGLSKVAGYMQEIADISGDRSLANISETLSGFGGMMNSIGQGFAQGGVVGGIIAATSSIFDNVADAIANAYKQEAIATKFANDWADAVERMAISVNEADFDTIFGQKSIGLGQAKIREATEALKLYYREVKNLQDMAVMTYDSTWIERVFGGRDGYTALTELAPQIIENGELNVEAARKFLEVSTQITDEQRKQIENAISLKEQYDDALKLVDDLISNTFGDIASDITDVIWDGVMNGTDAWTEFKKIGSEAITSLGKQLIQEMLISEYLEQFRPAMQQAYKAGSKEKTQEQLREVVNDIFGGLDDAIQGGIAVAEEWKNWAAANGFDLTNAATAETQTATAGGFQTMSQDTANELNGRFTALQYSNEVISQSAQAGVEFLSTISEIVGGGNGTLTEIRNLHMLEVGYLEDIAKQTKPILGFVETLSQIKENTDRL